jgi:hypothetical protein
MNVQEQLVAAYKAWEATRFSVGKEREEYNRLNALAVEEYKKELEVSKNTNVCSVDDPDCLNCGS